MLTALLSANPALADAGSTRNVLDIPANHSANAYFSHLADAAGSLTLPALLQNSYADLFSDGDNKTLNPGYTDAAYWLHGRFQLDADQAAVTRYFGVDYSLLDDVAFYVVQHGEVTAQWLTGDSRPFASRPIDTSGFLFPVEFKPGATLDIYIRIQTSSSMRVPLSIWEPEAFHNAQRPRLLTEGLYFGVIALMFVYNLCLLLRVKDVSYLNYLAYILAMAMLQLCLTGYGYEYFWPQYPRLNEFMLPVSVAAIGVFIIAFGLPLLELKRKSRVLSYACTTLLVLEAGAALVSLVLPYGVVIQSVITLSLLVSLVMMAAALKESLNGSTTAKLFLLAYVTLIIGSVALALASMGWLPVNFFTTNSLMIGSGVEIVVLSFALAERLNQINQEKARAEREATRYLEEINLHLRQANELKDEFLATISHELRTPMNGVLGCLEHLQQHGNPDQPNPYLHQAEHSARQMMSMVDSLLTYTEIQSGKLHVQSEPFRLRDLLEHSQQLFAETCQRKGINLQLDISEDTPGILLGDPHRISQVLNNLLDNAVKFTHQGAVKVAVCCHRMRTDKSLLQLEFTISDSGIGIPEAQQEQIFESFRSGDGKVKRGYGGLGIGLSVTKSLLDKMGGNLTFTSQPEQGSTFRASLPCQAASAEGQRGELDSAQNPAGQHPEGQSHTTLSVLVVEDNPVNQLVMKSLLNKFGYDVHCAGNGAEALELLRSQAVDLVLMDCQMPVMDGFTATRHIRNSDGIQKDVPIIAVTANAMSEDRHLCIQAGMNDYLCKPIDAQILSRKIIYWANRSPRISQTG